MKQLRGRMMDSIISNFNELLFNEISKIKKISFKEIENQNLQADKEVVTNSYYITDERLYFAIVTLLGDDECEISRDPDVIREVNMFTQGRFDWERDLKTNKFLGGYIGFTALDNYLLKIEDTRRWGT